MRVKKREEIVEMNRREGVKKIYVKKDKDEEIRMEERVEVMMGGKMIKIEKNGEIYKEKRNIEVEKLIGKKRINIMEELVRDKGVVNFEGREIIKGVEEN